MLSPEAERVLRYLVEVEELAEAVLSDKRQVRTPWPRTPYAPLRGRRKSTWPPSVTAPSSLAPSEHQFCVGQSLSFHPAPSLLVPWILTLCGRLL